MDDQWHSTDRPVLEAFVEAINDKPYIQDVEQLAGLLGRDAHELRPILRRLIENGYLHAARDDQGSGSAWPGWFKLTPTALGYRAVGAYPSPDDALERLLAALQEMAEDETQPMERRSTAGRILTTVGGAVGDVGKGTVAGVLGSVLAKVVSGG